MNNYSSLKIKHKKIKIPCEVCNKEKFSLFQNYGRVDEAGVYGKLVIKICKKCGYKMQNPRYENAFYEKYYQEMYREVAFGSLKPSKEYISQQKKRGKGVLKFIEKNGIKPGLMLDHGCASGATMLSWIQRGWKVSGIDPHRPSVQIGNSMGLDIKVASGEKLPNFKNKFNLIMSLGSLEHSYDLGKTLKECRRVLLNEGYLLIRWRSNKIFGSPLEYYNHNHYRFFTPNTWKLCLTKYGFSIINTTDDNLEGWPNYSYILAKKNAKIIKRNQDLLFTLGIKDDYTKEIDNLLYLRKAYFQRCKKFLNYIKKNKNFSAKKIIKNIKNNKEDFIWNFLGGESHEVLDRSIMEAKKYISEYSAGKVR